MWSMYKDYRKNIRCNIIDSLIRINFQRFSFNIVLKLNLLFFYFARAFVLNCVYIIQKILQKPWDFLYFLWTTEWYLCIKQAVVEKRSQTCMYRGCTTTQILSTTGLPVVEPVHSRHYSSFFMCPHLTRGMVVYTGESQSNR